MPAALVALWVGVPSRGREARLEQQLAALRARVAELEEKLHTRCEPAMRQ